ncbi:MAG: aminodeoxychorismate synthase component I [Candidatus Omnitrophota bacterium]
MIEPIIEELDRPPPPEAVFNSLRIYRNSFFLDSSGGSEKFGRFSFLGCEPFLIFKSKRDSVTLETPDGTTEILKANPFLVLKDILEKHKIIAPIGEKTPFPCGAAGYFAYDLKDFVEKLPDTAVDDLNLPDCVLGFYDTVVTYDNLKKKAYISGLSAKRLGEFKKRIFKKEAVRTASFLPPRPRPLRSNFSKASYMEAIKKAKLYIKKGDIYQVNLSQRFEADIGAVKPHLVYSRLRNVSPAPFSSYLGFEDVTILSSSPERFLSKFGSHIETRPIKGTRPRGRNEAEDKLLERELVESPKDNAEHIMIVDLERNDLGRICEYGSVRPAESAVLEKYANVFHLVSTVKGVLKKGVGPVDCLMAAFPGGSITGAPKIRSMEIIEELEPVKRSAYTGAIGYISFNGNMDTSIVIRTLLVKGRKAYFSVGGGIVADSVPEEEYEETLDKAKGLMIALGIEAGKEELVIA